MNLIVIQSISMSCVILAGFLMMISMCREKNGSVHPVVILFYLSGSIGWLIYGILSPNYFLICSASSNVIIYTISLCLRFSLVMQKSETKIPNFSDSTDSLPSFPAM